MYEAMDDKKKNNVGKDKDGKGERRNKGYDHSGFGRNKGFAPKGRGKRGKKGKKGQEDSDSDDGLSELSEEDAEALHRARLFIAMFNGGAGGDTQEAPPPVLATAEPVAVPVDNEGAGLAAGATMRL